MIGSSSSETIFCISASRTMKFVAQVSSSISSVRAPHSIASTTDAACEVLPLAFSVKKAVVSFWFGR